MLAVIGGTGIYSLGRKGKDVRVKTEYGVSILQEIELAGEKMIFLPRHGVSHTIPPHKVNYKANIAALEKLGVTGVISLYSAGIISKYKPGDLVLVKDFIGLWTPATFYDDFKEGMKHKDFTNPFSNDMKGLLLGCAKISKTTLKEGGIIATTPGPRFETKSEVKILKSMGANLVNMTAGYEMALLGESEIDFVSIVIASNYAAGIKKKPMRIEETLKVAHDSKGKLLTLIQRFVKEVV